MMKNKQWVLPLMAIISYIFLVWGALNVDDGGKVTNYSFSGFGLVGFLKNDLVKLDTILVSLPLYLVLLVLVGMIIASFIPKYKNYNTILSLALLFLVVYIVIGVCTLKADTATKNDFSGEHIKSSVSLTYGFYVFLAASIAILINTLFFKDSKNISLIKP